MSRLQEAKKEASKETAEFADLARLTANVPAPLATSPPTPPVAEPVTPPKSNRKKGTKAQKPPVQPPVVPPPEPVKQAWIPTGPVQPLGRVGPTNKNWGTVKADGYWRGSSMRKKKLRTRRGGKQKKNVGRTRRR